MNKGFVQILAVVLIALAGIGLLVIKKSYEKPSEQLGASSATREWVRVSGSKLVRSLTDTQGTLVSNSGATATTSAVALQVIGKSLFEAATTTNLAVTGISGSTQCLQANTNGTITGSGAACGTGTGGGGGAAWQQIWSGAITPTTTSAGIYVTASSTIAGLRVDGNLNVVGNATSTHLAVTGGNSDQWNTAFSWGNHSTAGYYSAANFNTDWATQYNATTTLNGFTPGNYLLTSNFGTQFATAYNATTTLNGFTNNQANWNTAYGWGNHASAGYLTTTGVNSLINASSTIAALLCPNGQIPKSDGTKWTCGTDNSGASAGAAWEKYTGLSSPANIITPTTTNASIYVSGNATTTGSLTAGSTLYVQSDTGNVGIGTTNPGSKLDIKAGTAGNLLNFQSAAGAFLSAFTIEGGLLMNIASTIAIRVQNGSGVDKFTVSSITGNGVFAGGVTANSASTTDTLYVGNLTGANCDVKATAGTGLLYCGTDATGGGTGSNWDWGTASGWLKPSTTVGIIVSASSTISTLTAPIFSSNNVTVTGGVTTTNLAISGLGTPAGTFLAVNPSGTVIATTTPAGGGGTPGGSDTQIQFNDGGSFGGAKIDIIDDNIVFEDDNVPTDRIIKIADQTTIDTSGNKLSIFSGKGNGSGGGGNLEISTPNITAGSLTEGIDLVSGYNNIKAGRATIGTSNVTGAQFELQPGEIMDGNYGYQGVGGYGNFQAGGSFVDNITNYPGGIIGGDFTVQGGGIRDADTGYQANGAGIIAGGAFYISFPNWNSGLIGGNLTLYAGLGEDGNGVIRLLDALSSINAILDTSLLTTSDKTFSFPNWTGNLLVASSTSLYVAENGNVGIGTSTPVFKLTSVDSVGMYGLTAAAGTPNSICQNNTTKEITVNSALTCTVSSRKFKQDIDYLQGNYTEELMKLKPVEFAYKDNPDRLRYGLIAEDVASVDKKLADGYDEQGNPNSLDQNALLALTIKTVQEQQVQIENLKQFKGIKTGFQYQWLGLLGLLGLIPLIKKR